MAEGGLVADDEYGAVAFCCVATLRPADCGEEADDVAVGAEAFVGFKGQAEGFGGLLTAQGGADEDAQLLGRVLVQPLGYLLGLFFAARGKSAFQVWDAVFGFGVAP